MKSTTSHNDQFSPEPTPQEEEAWREMEKRQGVPVAVQAQPKRPYNPSGSLSEYGVIPECDAPQPVSGADGLPQSMRDEFPMLYDSLDALDERAAEQPERIGTKRHLSSLRESIQAVVQRLGLARARIADLEAAQPQPSGNAGELPDERSGFEAWVNRLPFQSDLSRPAGQYRGEVAFAWMAWQARAALAAQVPQQGEA